MHGLSQDSFWNHVEELRRTFIKILWVIIIGTVLAFLFHPFFISLLTKQIYSSRPGSINEIQEIKTQRLTNKTSEPIDFKLPENSFLKYKTEGVKQFSIESYTLQPFDYLEWEQITHPKLLILSPEEGFSTVLKICFWIGLTLTCPIWCYFIFRFIAPALLPNEKSIVLPFLLFSSFFIVSGILFAINITIPITNAYLHTFNENLGLNLWSFSNYIDYTLLLVFSNVIAFELLVVIFLLVHFGVLTSEKMKQSRKFMILSSFILGALLTPPDILSQFLLALPMIVLYEAMILYSILKKKLTNN